METVSDKTTKIKELIEQQYPSVRAFAKESGMPHGTLVSGLRNGIEGMAYERVLRICECLGVDAVTLEPARSGSEITEQERRLLAYYEKLSARKQEKVIEYIKDIR